MTEIVAVVMDETEFEFILYLKKGYNQQFTASLHGGSQVGNPISCRNIQDSSSNLISAGYIKIKIRPVRYYNNIYIFYETDNKFCSPVPVKFAYDLIDSNFK